MINVEFSSDYEPYTDYYPEYEYYQLFHDPEGAGCRKYFLICLSTKLVQVLIFRFIFVHFKHFLLFVSISALFTYE